MKTLSLLALLAVAIYYHQGSAKPIPTAVTDDAAPQPARVAAPEIVIAPLPSYRDRWKTGPTACTDLKTGPNAQVQFEPFLPDSQANWNQNQPSGYTSVSGIRINRR